VNSIQSFPSLSAALAYGGKLTAEARDYMADRTAAAKKFLEEKAGRDAKSDEEYAKKKAAKQKKKDEWKQNNEKAESEGWDNYNAKENYLQGGDCFHCNMHPHNRYCEIVQHPLYDKVEEAKLKAEYGNK
jgi:hypothetical protein